MNRFSKILQPDQLIALRNASTSNYRRTILYTASAFDLLDDKGIQFLEHASRICNILVVGVMSDHYCSLMGYETTQDEQVRIRTIAENKCVTHVILINNDEEKIVRDLRPNSLGISPDASRISAKKHYELAATVNAEPLTLFTEVPLPLTA